MNGSSRPPTDDVEVLREIEERIRNRLAGMERENARLRTRVRILGAGLAVVAGLLAVVAVAPDALSRVGVRADGGPVEASAFRLVDGNGLTRGEWAVNEEGHARIRLMDPQQRSRLTVAVLQNGSPGLALIDQEGRRRAALGLLPDQTTTLTFADARETARAIFGLQNDAASLLLADGEGMPRLGLGLDAHGTGSTMLPEEGAEVEPGEEG